VVWGIHHTATERKFLKPATRAVVGLNAFLSHILPQKIICCAEAARETHIKLGYSRGKMTVISNGFNLAAFHPNDEARLDVRHELGLETDAVLIGMGARFAPEKDHANFFDAATVLLHQEEKIHFVLWGKRISGDNQALANLHWASEVMSNRFHLLGLRTDAARLLAAMDVFTLSSNQEAFPLAVGEAMAVGIPCVVTNVGDLAHIVGNTGRVVPPRDPQALSNAWKELLAMSHQERIALGMKARERIQEHFDLQMTATAYVNVYRDIIGSTSGGTSK
jgi:glycosyltransferase involved in cell wall biosynthesis